MSDPHPPSTPPPARPGGLRDVVPPPPPPPPPPRRVPPPAPASATTPAIVPKRPVPPPPAPRPRSAAPPAPVPSTPAAWLGDDAFAAKPAPADVAPEPAAWLDDAAFRPTAVAAETVVETAAPPVALPALVADPRRTPGDVVPDDDSPVQTLWQAAQCPHLLRHPFRFVAWVVRSLFGLATLILGLAIVAAIPIVNFVALGYLLEVEGRIARTGKLRHAFPLLHLAPRIGTLTLGVLLWLLPLWFTASQAAAARLIAPGSRADVGWHLALRILSVGITLHLCLALARGGTLFTFLRPIKNVRWLWTQLARGDYWDRAERGVFDFVAGLRLRHHFSLGLRGFAGAFLWLFIPTLFFAFAKRTDGQIFVTLFGGLLLVFVLSWTPFLQARFAAENRFGAFAELGEVRRLYRRAPLCWLLGVILTFGLSLPLYLATISLPPSDARWLVTLIFIVFIYPARVFVGWAYHQAARREKSTWFFIRWPCSWLHLPLLAFYIFLLFFTQTFGQHGKLVLFEHPALLLPMPF